MDDKAFDSIERAAEKQRSREEDEAALASGQKTREDLRRENGLFTFANVRIDLDAADERGS